MNFIKQLEYKELIKPLTILLGLSFVYNLAYLMLSGFMFSYMVQITLCLLSSMGLYWICTKVWKLGTPITFIQLFQVMMIEMIWLILLFVVLEPLSRMSIENVAIDIGVQIASAILVLFASPFELLYFYQLHSGKTNVKEIFKGIKDVLKKNSRTILNWYCVLLVAVILVDTLTGGLFSVISGFDAYELYVAMILFGNPLMNCMMQMFIVAGFGLSIWDVALNLFLFFMIGLWVGLFELNYVAFLGRKCKE